MLYCLRLESATKTRGRSTTGRNRSRGTLHCAIITALPARAPIPETGTAETWETLVRLHSTSEVLPTPKYPLLHRIVGLLVLGAGVTGCSAEPRPAWGSYSIPKLFAASDAVCAGKVTFVSFVASSNSRLARSTTAFHASLVCRTFGATKGQCPRSTGFKSRPMNRLILSL